MKLWLESKYRFIKIFIWGGISEIDISLRKTLQVILCRGIFRDMGKVAVPTQDLITSLDITSKNMK